MTWCRQSWLVAATLALAVAVAAPACAQDALHYGGDRSFPPFESLDAESKPQGFQIELLHEIERLIGRRIDTRLDDWQNIEQDFRAGRLDIIAMTVTSSRREWAAFARSHAAPVTGIYYRKGVVPPVSLEDLAGHLVAMNEHSEALRHTRETFLGGGAYRFVLLPSAADAMRAVQDGRAEFALMSRAYGDRLLAAGTAPDVAASDYSIRLQAYGFAVAPGNEALRKQLDGAIEQLERQGKLEALRKKWLATDRDALAHARLEIDLRRQYGLLAAALLVFGLTGVYLLSRLRDRARRLGEERSRRLDTERELRLAREKLDHAFTNHPDGMIVTDSGGVVLELNAALRRMFGWSSEQIIGRQLRETPLFSNHAILDMLRAQIHEHGAFENIPLELRLPDGTPHFFVASGQRVDLDGDYQTVSVVRDVTASMHADAALRAEFQALAAETLRQAQELDQVRSQALQSEEALHEFTAALTHDLRAPLRAISGFTGLLREELAAGKVSDAIASAESIEAATRRMDAMIEGLTRLARLGSKGLQRTRFDIEAQVRAVWGLLAAADPGRDVAFAVTSLPPTDGDMQLIAQVWQNLLDNARKYSAQTTDAAVAVDSFEEAGRSWYRVTDNGVGFDMARAQRLFEPFSRMHSSHEFAGSGIGLSVVRRIVQVHGGEIRARSTPGTGTIMAFTLQASVNQS